MFTVASVLEAKLQGPLAASTGLVFLRNQSKSLLNQSLFARNAVKIATKTVSVI
jgi:hypothetical protein